ncbi:hypothetical protein CBL_21248, partial [Carabus blaptoides fortunei]
NKDEFVESNALVARKFDKIKMEDAGKIEADISPERVLTVPRKVKVGNNDFIEALGEGNIEIKAFNGATWKSATIKKVLYVPDIANNLFSEGAALDKGLKYESDKDECTFYKNETVVATGRRFGKLFKMNFRLSADSECEAQIATVMDWHRLLGHQNMQHIRQ